MFLLLTTWVTERMVSFLAVALIFFSTLPTTLTVIARHDSDEAVRIELIQQVRAEGDALLVKLTAAEQNCDAQLGQLVTLKTSQPAAVVQRLILDGKEREHQTVVTFVQQVRSEEARIVALKDLDDDDVLIAVERIHLIGTAALGPTGLIVVTCQTIIIEIRTIIEVVVIHGEHEDDD